MRPLAPALALVGWTSTMSAAAEPGLSAPLPFGPGEQVAFRITYAHLLAGRATLAVRVPEREGEPGLRFVAEARSQGFFAWLFRSRRFGAVRPSVTAH